MSTLGKAGPRRGWAILVSLFEASALVLPLLGSAQAQPPADREIKTVTGVVKEFTTAPEGEVDGAVLEDGTVIHWPPHLQDRFQVLARKGDKVRVRGWMETGPEGDTHLEVRTLTNLRTSVSRSNDDAPPRGGPRAAPGPRDPEQRLQRLEDQVEELRKEIQRLRRDK